MFSKIIVNKYQLGCENKSLRISIQDDDSTPARYGTWSNKHVSPKRVKPPRIVVQVLIGGKDVNPLDLDGCAQQFQNVETIDNTIGDNDEFNTKAKNCDFTSKLASDDIIDLALNNPSFDGTPSNPYTFADYFKKYDEYPDRNFESTNRGNDNFISQMNPLDYYIKKVNQNNKEIVRNIQTLNEAIDYCKKKERIESIHKSTENSCGDYDKSFVSEPTPRRPASRANAEPAMWLTVWACSACQQAWPRRDVVGRHAQRCPLAADKDVVCEHDTCALLQCEFCEKVFRSLLGLTRHLETHTTSENYQCEPCEAAFASYQAVELHWQQCLWLHRSYYFNLTKMRPCNVCDLKFPTYDQLYNHRYSAGHLKMKRHRGLQSGGDTWVYQCEQCAQLFVSDSYLLVHRQSSHGPSTDNHYHDGLSQFLQVHPQLYNNAG